MVPVQLRVIEKEFDSLPLALVRKLLERIALERSPVDDVVGRGPRRKHREAVVVTRGDGDVAGSGGLGERHPFVGVELDGIELRGQPLISRRRNLFVLHHPLAGAELGVDAPVDEHPEPGVAEPLTRGETLGGRGGR